MKLEDSASVRAAAPSSRRVSCGWLPVLCAAQQRTTSGRLHCWVEAAANGLARHGAICALIHCLGNVIRNVGQGVGFVLGLTLLRGHIARRFLFAAS